MTIDIEEGSFKFKFCDSSKPTKFEKDRIPLMTHCLKAVDIMVEWEKEVWLIEVKEPKSRDELDFERIISQGKDSFLYLYLNNRLDKEKRLLKYYVFISFERFNTRERTLLIRRLQQAFCLPRDCSITKKYIDAACVYNEETWNKKFPDKCPVNRIP
jgi:hypothetical protein